MYKKTPAHYLAIHPHMAKYQVCLNNMYGCMLYDIQLALPPSADLLLYNHVFSTMFCNFTDLNSNYLVAYILFLHAAWKLNGSMMPKHASEHMRTSNISCIITLPSAEFVIYLHAGYIYTNKASSHRILVKN
jgi:hypothetical protein